MEEDYNLAERYRIVRKHLDRLGYRQALSLDALPLIERLLADLIQTTDSLEHFKTVAQDNIEACSQLQLATEPYKCDNARLVQECNQLHLKLLETNEAHQKQIKELKKQIRKFEIDCNDLQLVTSRNIKKIKELETESAAKSNKILELQGKCCKPVISNTNLATKKRACFPLRRPTLEADPLPRTGSNSSTLPSSRNVDAHVVDLLGIADHRMNCLNREVTKLKGELSVQSDNIHTLKSQLASKEKEIMRLKKMLDGGRPLSAVTKDCFCKKTDKSYYGDNGELKILERAKQDLEEQLKDSMTKQHEAMSRALKLAERNEELEKELRDIDHIALAVEADCNSAVQENNRRVSRLQEKVEDLMTQVHVLESELTVERREAQELRADLESCKLEKRNIQRVLESTLDEKKQMTDKINQLTIIEKDLNNTIERLTRDITHLESSNNILKDQMYTISISGGGGGGGGDEKHKEKGEKNDKNIKGKKILKKKTTAAKPRSMSPTTNKQTFNGNREDEVSRDAYPATMKSFENQRAENEKDLNIESMKKTIERLETERDYYRNEYNKFREEFNLVSNGDNADLWTQACELRRQLNEKEQAMAELQREKKALDREKFNLEARLQTSKNQQRKSCIPCSNCSSCRPAAPCNCSSSPPSGGDTNSTKAMVERLERERDTARGDVDRLVEERDALRERLKIAVDAHTSEQRRLRENLSEAETRLKQLENERQDLMLSQGTRRATINGLEDQLEDLRQELRRTKEELTTQRTQYFQLRALQEQTDQALGDVQGQLGQSETELNKMMDHKKNIEQQKNQLENQVKELKQECNMLRSNLAQLDQEKDQLLMNLDEKTERIAALEREVRFKEQQGNGLEQQVGDFQHKYQICVDQTAEQERQLRTMEVEINNLQRQLASASMDRENAIRENARIQDDLASVTCECRNLQRELEVSRAESHDLKRQLQTYVTEVRRAEELLNRKENERSEMLNHFRSLSLEATVLETNNQSLESEAAEARGALQTAQDRLLDLERQIADRDCLIRGYETQIAELTQNVASMETQLHQQGEQRKRAEADLNAVRDLCVKLDQQKESLEAQLVDKETLKAQCESQLSRLRAEQNMVQDQMTRDNAAVDRLEAMLNQARQESMSNAAMNQEMQSEMARLKQKISDLQNKLLAETSELRRYQNQAAEYSKQISELRRQMTNERFDRARKEEESRRAELAPKFTKETCPPCISFKSPTPAPRPDPKSVNQWKTPAPRNADWLQRPYNALPNCSCVKNQCTNNVATNHERKSSYSPRASPPAYAVPSPHVAPSMRSNSITNSNSPRMPEEMKQRCCGKEDMKKEAQRTNRFTTNYSSHNSVASPSITPCSHFESTSSRLCGDDYKTQGIGDIPCISIILKPILDSKTESNDKDVQIVEVAAVTENINKHCTNKQVTSYPDQRQSASKETEKLETKCIKVQTEDVKNICDNSTQTPHYSLIQKSIEVSAAEPETPLITTGHVNGIQRIADADINRKNRGVQFRNDDVQSLFTTHRSDNQNRTKREEKTSTSSIEHSNSTVTLCKLVQNEDKSGRSSLHIEDNGRGKLSDRIKRNIDKLETGNNSISTQSSIQENNPRCSTWQGSVEIQPNLSTCKDICKENALEVEFSKTHPTKTNTFQSTQNSSNLSSVLSNNPPIPQVSINTTEFEDSKFLSKNRPVIQKSHNQYDDDKNKNAEKINSETMISPLSPRRFWNTELSSLGFDKMSETKSTNTSYEGKRLEPINNLETKSTNTSYEVKRLEPINDSSIGKNTFVGEKPMNSNELYRSIAIQTNSTSFSKPPEYSSSAKPESISSKSNTGNVMTASDLTRPEFIRMLTEIKERTCSLESHLSAMNEALKRKQATRSEVLHSTPKNYEQKRQDYFDYETQAKKLKTRNQPLFSTNELSSIEYAKLSPKVFGDENSPGCDNSISKIEELNDLSCCGRNQIVSEAEESSRVVGENESNISLLKNGTKKPAFKTRRSFLWAPVRQSDHRMRRHKARNTKHSMPDSFMVKSKIDVSCSPTNCCDISETTPQIVSNAAHISPVYKSEKSDNTLKSTHSTASNPSINRRIIRPAVMSSTLKNSINTSQSNKPGAAPELRIKDDTEGSYLSIKLPEYQSTSTTMGTSCGLNDLEYLKVEQNCCESTKSKPVSEAVELTRKSVVPSSLISLKGPSVRPRLGFKQSSMESPSTARSKSIPSYTNLCSSTSKESFPETSTNTSSKSSRFQHNGSKTSSIQFKRVGAIPRLKLMSSRSKNPAHNGGEKDNSRVNLDSICCGVENAEESTPEANIAVPFHACQSTHEKIRTKSIDQKKGKNHFAYTIKTEQNTPFSRNKFSKFDSEEEMNSTDYGINKSGRESFGKDTKDHVNDKKRKRNSENDKLMETQDEANLTDSNNSKVRNWPNDSQSFQCIEQNKCNLENRNVSKCSDSEKVEELVYRSGKYNQNNTQQKDSKCTIRVTVSLDDTPSNGKLKKI